MEGDETIVGHQSRKGERRFGARLASSTEREGKCELSLRIWFPEDTNVETTPPYLLIPKAHTGEKSQFQRTLSKWRAYETDVLGAYLPITATNIKELSSTMVTEYTKEIAISFHFQDQTLRSIINCLMDRCYIGATCKFASDNVI